MKLTKYPESPESLVHVVDVSTYASRFFDSRPHPFLPRKKRTLEIIVSNAIRMLERVLRTTFFVKNEERELVLFSKPVLRMLSELVEEGGIVAWEPGLFEGSFPYAMMCNLRPAPVKLPNGRAVENSSLTTSGAAKTLDESAKIALAEFIERDAMVTWDQSKKIRLKNAEASKKVDARKFILHTTKEDPENEQIWGEVAYDIANRKQVVIPSQLTYLYYPQAFPEEKRLRYTSTNGVAAYTDFETALVSAFYENVERDAFLMHWLSNSSPDRIDISTVPVNEVKAFFTQMHQNGVEIHLLDCTTDLKLPVLIMVLVDRRRTSLVRVSGVSGYDFESMLRKVVLETSKWFHLGTKGLEYYRWGSGSSTIDSVQTRGMFWSQPANLCLVDFFVRGQTASYSEYMKKFSTVSLPRNLNEVRGFLKQMNLEGYEVNKTTELARRYNLHVGQYIIPQLLPLYFEERFKPIHSERLSRFMARKSEQSNKGKSEIIDMSDYNNVPHPFL